MLLVQKGWWWLSASTIHTIVLLSSVVVSLCPSVHASHAVISENEFILYIWFLLRSKALSWGAPVTHLWYFIPYNNNTSCLGLSFTRDLRVRWEHALICVITKLCLYLIVSKKGNNNKTPIQVKYHQLTIISFKMLFFFRVTFLPSLRA